jgi:hypothetical protein
LKGTHNSETCASWRLNLDSAEEARSHDSLTGVQQTLLMGEFPAAMSTGNKSETLCKDLN